MKELFPLIFAAFSILAVGVFQILLLKYLNRNWWNRRVIRRAAYALPMAGVVTVALWAVGTIYDKSWLSSPMAVLATLVLVLEVGLMLSLPWSGLVHLTHRLAVVIGRKRPVKRRVLDSKRRAFLKSSAIILPATTAGLSVAGVAQAVGPVDVRLEKISLPNLPPELEGVRFLHLSDCHLGTYFGLRDLEDVLEQAEALKPDMVLASGDIADDLNQLGPALSMIEQLRPRLGAYATYGNHEYFRGAQQTARIYDKSPVQLLVNQSSSVQDTGIYVVGLDDPVHMRGGTGDFFRHSVEQAMFRVPIDSLKIMMSHRPVAIEEASQYGVDLVVAGHTHGGQIGWRGRSIFEGAFGAKYLWGHYTVGSSRLYTSAGTGHWFPYRFQCQAEAPVFELTRS